MPEQDNNISQIDNINSERLSAAELADPALWRLTVYIGAGKLRAYLRNTADPTLPMKTLAAADWNCKPQEILQRIESAVYDNPSMLEDYSADIVIESDRTLWAPTEMVPDEDAVAENYNVVFPEAAEDDIFADFEGEAVCLYHLCSGLGAFIRRTFPGSRVTSQMTQLYRRFRRRPTEKTALYADLRDELADILILDRGRLLQSSTHPARNMAEAQYHLLNCLCVSGVNLKETEIFLSGTRDLRAELIKELREELPLVRNTMLPRIDSPKEMPTAALICMTGTQTNSNS